MNAIQKAALIWSRPCYQIANTCYSNGLTRPNFIMIVYVWGSEIHKE